MRSIVKRMSIVACCASCALSSLAASDKPLLPTPITKLQNHNLVDFDLVDLNGDGQPDLVGRTVNLMMVAIGAAPASFGPSSTLSFIAQPRGLVTADFDLDGSLDIATADGTTNSVLVAPNDGAGNFTWITPSLTITSPWDVDAADFDLDGRPDLVVTSPSSSSFAVHLGGPGGVPTSATSFPGIGVSAYSVRAADCDGDGNADACFGFAGFSGVVTALGNGTGSFVGLARTMTSVLVFNTNADLTDVTGDQLPDLLLPPEVNFSSAQILPGTPSGAFGAPIVIPFPEHAFRIRGRDLDGDGRGDLLVRSRGSADLLVASQATNGSFLPVRRHGTGGAIEADAPFELADLDGDTYPDYVAAEPSGQIVTVRGNASGSLDGLATFMPKNGTSDPGTAIPSPTDVAAFDADLDGIADTAFTFANGAGFMRTIAGSDNIDFAPHTQFAFSGPAGPTPALDIGDLNSDADLDIVAINGLWHTMTLKSMLGGVSATFGAPLSSVISGSGSNDIARDVALGDFTNDGRLDAIVALSGPISRVLGLGNGSFGFSSSLSLDAPAERIALGDFNLDGDLDVACSSGSGSIDLGFGNGLGHFATTPGSTVAAGLYGPLHAYDLDNDGSLELIYGSSAGVITVPTLGGVIGPFSAINVGSFVRDVAVDDLDGDGDLDFAAHADGGVVVGLRDSIGATSLFGPFAASLQIAATAIDLGDYSGDGLPDVVTASSQSSVGAIRVMPSSPPPTAITQTYGSGKAGSSGVPLLTSLAPPKLGAASGISITNGLPGASSLLFVGVIQIATPFDLGTLLVQPLVTLSLPPFDGNGDLALPYVIANSAALCGVELRFQAVFVDPAAPGPLHTAQSNGLRWVFGA